MALQINLDGTISLSDPSTGTVTAEKIVSAVLTGTISTISESTTITTSPSTINLPISPTQVVYIKNLSGSSTVTVTWTANTGISQSIITLQPNSMILLCEANTTSGITALSLVSNGTASVEYILGG